MTFWTGFSLGTKNIADVDLITFLKNKDSDGSALSINSPTTNVDFSHEDFPHITSHCFIIVEKICSELSSKGYSFRYKNYNDDPCVKIQFLISWFPLANLPKFLNNNYVN